MTLRVQASSRDVTYEWKYQVVHWVFAKCRSGGRNNLVSEATMKYYIPIDIKLCILLSCSFVLQDSYLWAAFDPAHGELDFSIRAVL